MQPTQETTSEASLRRAMLALSSAQGDRGLARRSNPSAPLPAEFDPSEPGLMTKSEFLEARNPGNKFHSSDAYDTDLARLNDHLAYVGNDRGHSRRYGDWTDYQIYRGPGGHVVRAEGRDVAVVIDGVLHHPHGVREEDLPRRFVRMGGELEFEATSLRRVKYLGPMIERVRKTAEANAERYPYVVARVSVGGEAMVVRAERKPEKDAGVSIAIMDATGRRVASAGDEWGATLLMVAREYRRRGLGRLIGSLWYEQNPSYPSGGFTPSGQANALRVWEARVGEFMSRGWYTALVAAGRVAAARVREIVAGLSAMPRPTVPLPSASAKPSPQAPAVRILLSDFGFVVYDAAFLEDRDEKYVLARGFFRDSEHVGQFLFAIDYEPAYRKLANYVALQMARDGGDPVYVGPGYGDLMELEGMEHLERDGDYVRLTRDVFPLKDFARVERGLRRPLDPHGEIEQTLWELSESKWS